MKAVMIQGRTGEPVPRQSLAERKFEVIICSGLANAKQRCQSESCHLIIVHADDHAGILEFLSWVRQHAGRSAPYVVITVSAERHEQAMAYLQAGADDIILSPYDLKDLPLRLAAAERQITRRLGSDRLAEELNTRSQQQVAVAALGQCAISEDLPTLMDLLSRLIMHTLEAEFCSLMEVHDDRKVLKCVAGQGWKQGIVGSSFQPLEGSFLWQTLQGEGRILGNLASDKPITSPDPLLQEHGVVSGISAAVKGRSGLLGALGIFTAGDRHFSEDDLHFVEGLANVVGAAMDRQRSEAEIRKHQEQAQHLQKLESIGQLTAGVAHDYNNVLTVIHGHVTLVLGDPQLPTKSAASLKTALEAVERAAGLTRQLLAFSRKQSMRSDVVDLHGIIGGVTKMMGRFLGENIRLEFRPGPFPATVQADPGMMEQVIMNLAVNARDAMPSGGSLIIATELVTIQPGQVESHVGWRAGQFVRITVTDTGCGMDEATVGRIFEPFFTTKGPGKGTGLGLATVFGIVKQHQGWIDVESQLGKGTTFSIYLPNLAKAVATQAAAGPESIARGQQETILLVEDEPALRQLARLLLEEFGYTVVEAGSGAEALQRWGEHKQSIQLLLTDLVLPDALTGFDLAETLRKQRSDLKVVVTSGYEAGKVPGKLPGGAGFHFIQKPYRTAVLARTIREALSGVAQSKVDSVS